MLPIQQRVGPAPEPVVGTDESGLIHTFMQPRMALGIPEAIAAPVHSLVNSADATARGEAPATEDILRVIATGALSGLSATASKDVLMSIGAKAEGLVNRPNITPASIASEHALDMAAIDRQAMESVAKKNTPEKP